VKERSLAGERQGGRKNDEEEREERRLLRDWRRPQRVYMGEEDTHKRIGSAKGSNKGETRERSRKTALPQFPF